MPHPVGQPLAYTNYALNLPVGYSLHESRMFRRQRLCIRAYYDSWRKALDLATPERVENFLSMIGENANLSGTPACLRSFGRVDER